MNKYCLKLSIFVFNKKREQLQFQKQKIRETI
jgi:hypothetical protein